MKNGIILLGVLIVLTISCSSKLDENNILGNWEIIDFTINSTILSPEVIKNTKESSIFSVYTFYENNTYDLKAKYPEHNESGNWILKKTNKSSERLLELTSKIDNEEIIDEYIIQILNVKEMEWIKEIGEITGESNENLKIHLIKN